MDHAFVTAVCRIGAVLQQAVTNRSPVTLCYDVLLHLTSSLRLKLLRMETGDHIVVVDDDAEIRSLLTDYLGRNGYRAKAVPDGRALWPLLDQQRVDLVVLDLMLPGEDGLEICRRLRNRSRVPIIMLTARGEMEAMIDETLEFMRGIASQEAAQPVNIGALLESLQADAEERGASFRLVVDELAPYPAQPVALKRCITNLVDNATKYADQVTLRVDDTGEALRIIVTDDGPGIPASEITRVFEPFYRVEKSRSRETGGAGMGLAVAQAIARNHGGEIRLRNLPEGGLQATLELPRAHRSSVEVGDT